MTIDVQASTPNQPPVTSTQQISVSQGQTQAFLPITGTDPDGNTPLTFATTAIDPLLGCTESDSGNRGNIIYQSHHHLAYSK